MTSERRVAIDSTVLVNFFTGGANDPPEWLEHSKWVMRAGERGGHRLILPALVIAELAGAGPVRGTDIPKKERRTRINAVLEWLAASQFLVVDIDDRVARRAAELAIEHQLSGGDACVLAAAVSSRCAALYTWDDDLLKIEDQVSGLVVIEPQFQDEQTEIEF